MTGYAFLTVDVLTVIYTHGFNHGAIPGKFYPTLECILGN